MKLDINYEELKKALDEYDKMIEKGDRTGNKDALYIDESNELQNLSWDFGPYKGKSKSQDTQISLIEDCLGKYVWNFSISKGGPKNGKRSRYKETEYNLFIAEKDLYRFGRYYRNLLSTVKRYDENGSGSYQSGTIKERLKKNLSLGYLGAASVNYRGLMKLYGKKKADSILKKVKKETGAKVVVKSKTAKVKNKKGKVVRTYKKFSIVAKKDKDPNSGSGASKKVAKSKTKKVVAKQVIIKKKKK